MIERRRIRVETAPGNRLVGRFEAMASPCEVLADGADEYQLSELTGLVATEVWRIERQWSRYLPDNIVSRINRAEGREVEVDEETARFLNYAEHLYEMSSGLFDVTSGVLRKAWQFDGSDRLPDANAVAALLPLVGWGKVQWRPPVMRMLPAMQIDFGGIGKEYAVDRACALAAAKSRFPVLVNCGGDLAASSKRTNGEPWLVGIDARIENCATSVIKLLSGAVATSGDTHRFLFKDGVRYPHILNPKTGWPVIGAPRVVTVAAETCTEAGVLSTLALLNGAQAEVFLRNLGAECKVIW